MGQQFLHGLDQVDDHSDAHEEGADGNSHGNEAVADAQGGNLTVPALNGHGDAVDNQNGQEDDDSDLEDDIDNLTEGEGELLDDQVNADQAGAAQGDVRTEEDHPGECNQSSILCPVQGETNVYLEQELEALDDYLYIQQMRYDSRISCKKDIRVNPFAVKIPSFTLQPIVENALTHGMREKEDGGRIYLKIWQDDSTLIISVMDNGKGMTQEEKAALNQKILNSEKTGKSIGLGNLFRRMEVLYPEGSIRIYSKENKGTIVQLHIPQCTQKEGRTQ